MKLKNILLSAITALAIFTLVTTNADAVTKEINKSNNACIQSIKLQPNQTELFYMYSNDTGHYFLDPKAEYENVIYVGLNDYLLDNNFKMDTPSLHHGQKFIGTFADDTLWELTGLEVVSK